MAAIADLDRVAVALQQFLEQLAQQRFVVNTEDLQRLWCGTVVFRDRAAVGGFAHGKDQSECGAFAQFALDFNSALVPFHDTIDHREAQAGATFAFGGEKGFEAAFARFFAHADAGVADLDHHVCGMRSTVLDCAAPGNAGAEGDFAAVRQRVHGVQNEVGQRFADFAFNADQFRHIRRQVRLYFEGGAVGLWNVTPARPGHLHDLSSQSVEIQLLQGFCRVATAIELAQARDDMGNVFAGGADVLEVLLSGGTQAVLCAQHQVGKSDHRGEGVVDVMRDAAGHLAQRLETFLLHGGLLGLAQLVVGLLKFAVKPRLMRGERDVFAQHAEELTFPAAEAIVLSPRGKHDSKRFVFDEQRHRDGGTQAGTSEFFEERFRAFQCIGQIEGLSLLAQSQSGVSQRQHAAFVQIKRWHQERILHAQRRHVERLGLCVEQRNASEVEVEMVFKLPQDDAHNALEVLPFRDDLGNLVQQTDAPELLLQRGLCAAALGDFGLQVLGALCDA